MNRKATIVLLISSIGFLVTALLLLNYNARLETGKMHLELLGAAAEGEQLLFFLDKSAEYSLKNAVDDKLRNFCRERERECVNKLEENFEQNFAVYVEKANEAYDTSVSVDHYELAYEYDTAAQIFKVAGRAEIVLEMENMAYKTVHDFGISAK